VGEQPALTILDIGTGSGCIAIALKKRLPGAVVMAIDKSTGALQLARENAQTLGAEVYFGEVDIFNPQQLASLGPYRVVVSNPPYVPLSAAADMRPNVRRYEPHLALFVADADPLVFYRQIAAFGMHKLTPGGMLFFEIHAGTGLAVQSLLEDLGYVDVELRADLSGLDRMVAATRP
jgi:release factor glutamine methyltransferase